MAPVPVLSICLTSLTTEPGFPDSYASLFNTFRKNTFFSIKAVKKEWTPDFPGQDG